MLHILKIYVCIYLYTHIYIYIYYISRGSHCHLKGNENNRPLVSWLSCQGTVLLHCESSWPQGYGNVILPTKNEIHKLASRHSKLSGYLHTVLFIYTPTHIYIYIMTIHAKVWLLKNPRQNGHISQQCTPIPNDRAMWFLHAHSGPVNWMADHHVHPMPFVRYWSALMFAPD